MAWTGVLGLAVRSVPAYASVHCLKLYVFPVQCHFCIFTESLPYTHNHLFITMYFEAFEFFTNSEGARIPKIQCCIHNKPLGEECLGYTKIITLDLRQNREAIWDMLACKMVHVIKQVFNIHPNGTALTNWSNTVYNYLITKIQSLQHKQNMSHCTVLLISTDEGPQLTFYLPWADTPAVNYDNSADQYFILHICNQEIKVARAASASDTNSTEKANNVKCKDPPIEELGDPRDLHNYLLDSGTTQHMTPRLANLEEVVEGRKLGVEVADGHIIKCPATGKIRISMIDDNGNPIEAKLHDVMYVPGLNRRLFSITRFAPHGHYAVFQNATITLHFAPSWARVSLTTPHREQAFVANSMVMEQQQESEIVSYHQIPTHRNKETDYKRLPLELVHARLGHSKCRTLLAANDHRLWKDAVIRMSPETGCLSLGIATACSTMHNKEHHSGAVHPGE
jgi:hypothetical protein